VTHLLRHYDRSNLKKYDSVCIYPLSLFRRTKRTFYAFMPSWVAEKVKRIEITEYLYRNNQKRHNLVGARHIRKFVAAKMFELGVPAEVVDFIQGRVPRTILARHYLNILPKAVQHYKRYAKWIKEELLST